MNTTTALATAPKASLVTRFATRYHIDPDKLLPILKATAFRQRDGKTVTNEQMAALLVVADQYGLNPFTKEIYAFEDKGAIVPVVSVDGWARIINSHPEFDGVDFRYSDEIVTLPGAKPCPAWAEAVIYRKDRSRPIVVREYLDEVYIKPRGNPPKDGPWQTHTKRFHRHKTLIQGARIAFGFAGIYDQDEAERIIEGEAVRIDKPAPSAAIADLNSTLAERSAAINAEQGAADSVVDAEFTDAPPPDPKRIRAQIHMADDLEQLEAASDLIDGITDEAVAADLRDLVESRREAMEG